MSWTEVVDRVTGVDARTRLWRPAFEAVPRAAFLPDVLWLPAEDGQGYVALDRRDDPQRWWDLVHDDVPIVTQVDDGTPATGRGRHPSSSSSMPAVMAVMLGALDPDHGDRVLEIGTGTGYNAALLAHRLGAANVTSIEIDPSVADDARHAVAAAGYPVRVITGDGATGHPDWEPYDRILVTAAVTDIPYPWVDQTRPGGRIVTPWGTRLLNGSLLSLTVDGDGTAHGHIVDHAAFMQLRHQRPGDWFPDLDSDATEGEATLHPYRPIGDDEGAAFAVSVLLPDVERSITYHDDARTDYLLVLLHEASASWATVTVTPAATEAGRFPVRQSGPRRLWDEVITAHGWWLRHGSPAYTRFGVSVTPTGQRVWLDRPDRVVPAR